MTKRKSIDELIREAIQTYNRYRAPEARAEVLEIDEDGTVRVLFEGHFCVTCGVNDYIEDLKYFLEDVGVRADLQEIVEPNNPEEFWRIGVFKIRSDES